MQSDKGPIRIDIAQVLRQRLGSRMGWLQRPLAAMLARLIHQDELNELLSHNYPQRGADFCRGVLADLDVTMQVSKDSVMPDKADRRVILVSNHPLGGLDGMALIAWLTEYYGTEVRFVVNDLLMAVEPLRPVFLPINKHGSQSRDSLGAIDTALAGGKPVIIFPAGLVSRRGHNGRIADLEWKKMFVNKAIEYGRNVVPMHFGGTNSPSFYRMASWRKRMGIKFNAEMALLPREVFRSRGKTFTLTIGRAIDWHDLEGGAGSRRQADAIRQLVYSMEPQGKSTKQSKVV